MFYKTKLAIYGYGALGKIVEAFLQKEGIQPIAIIDNYKCDHATISFDKFSKKYKDDKVDIDAVIISISDFLIIENCIQELTRENIPYGIILNGEQVIQNKKLAYNNILWSDKDRNLIEIYLNLRNLEAAERSVNEKIDEIYWAHVYHDTIRESDWLMDKSVSTGRWAVGYNFLYVLYRVLNDSRPQKILELGLGQSTKLTMQYTKKYDAEHLVIEHDERWKEWFLKTLRVQHNATRVLVLPLVEKGDLNSKYYEYQGFKEKLSHLKGMEVVLIDGPFGGDNVLSRRDILTVIPDILNENFIIILDDYGRIGEKRLAKDIQKKLENYGIHTHRGIYGGRLNKDVCVIASETNKYFASL